MSISLKFYLQVADSNRYTCSPFFPPTPKLSEYLPDMQLPTVSLCYRMLVALLFTAAIGGCATQHGASLSSQSTSGIPANESGIAADEPDADGDRTLAVLWGRFRTTISLPDPEHQVLGVDEAEVAAEDTLAAEGDAGGELADDGANDDTDLWTRVRSGFRLDYDGDARLAAERNWYVNHPEYLARTVERARPYMHLIVSEIERRDMPMEIALLPIVESAFQPFAYSHGRAAGLWQFIPSTARIYGLRQNWWYDGRRDVQASTEAALDYLNNLQARFDGDWLLALAAYNSGTGTVRQAIAHNRRRGRPTDFWSLHLPRETRAYVPKLLALRDIFAAPHAYGLTLASIPDEPYVTPVWTGSQIDLALAADLANLSLDQFYELNPGFNRWATDPDGSHMLLVPLEKAADFCVNLAELPPKRRIEWAHHRIREGETLGEIAHHYRTTVTVLRQVNKIRGNLIRAGHDLMIPVATRELHNYTLSQDQRKLAAQNRSRQGTKIVHVVRRGDTLWDISRLYRVGVRQLASWNGMATRDTLRPGQRLVIWRTGAHDTADITLNGKHPLDGRTQRISYVVRKGDSLSRISQRFNVKVSQVRRWNSLRRDSYLQPGQHLTLFIDITRQTENI